MKKLASVVLLGSVLLTGCEDANEIKEDAAKAKAEMQKTLGDAWDEVKDTTTEFKGESLDELLAESKKLGLDMYDDGKEVALDAWIESKEAAGELTEKTKQKAQELAEELREAREQDKDN
ncbi:hypothetical protein NQT69_04485 [Pseudoalteromonas shioyasakiensis]|uniref:hypothetical protein n=1 Tax=Pseudoalteromonas shioyasakiensis TaxID=1190813 RepID=UPI002117674F|nr:hypothetical protein [Pseudoalteromonas shioyasakiensis]MCQ8877292.1 hypothetical protein [Pseudoalteromonas shioyasakiensis]